jgi:uncharacterized protein
MDAISENGTASARATAQPVLGAERIAAIDVLRGVAVLGILLMNITGFALPFAASFDPTVGGGHTGSNLWVWAVGAVLFEGKMRAIFSMLFGAGMLVLTSRLEQRGLAAEAADIYYRRLLWLLAFGLVHAYFIWWGDILFFYAVLGLLLYPLRRLSARVLIAAGLVLLLIGAGRSLASAIDMRATRDAAKSAEAAAAAGQSLTDEQKRAQAASNEQASGPRPSAEELSKEIEAYRGSYLDAFRQRTGLLTSGQPQWLFNYFVYDIGGMMLLGIGLLKLRVFTAALPMRAYMALAAVGYGIGIPVATLAVSHDIRSGFEPLTLAFGTVLHALARIPVALGHVAVVMLVCKAGVVRWLRTALAAVGQTAFSCYIAESLICTTLFYGYGFGLFARLDRFQQLLVVLAVWVVLLIVSPLWLKRFRFGPLEWLWRSLTYLERQPMRLDRLADSSPAAAQVR